MGSWHKQNFMVKETLVQLFSFEFFKIFKNSFFVEHLRATELKNERILVVRQLACTSWGNFASCAGHTEQ